MGLLDKLRGEFIDIVEWLDKTNDTMVWRFPRYDNEIKYGARLVVREGQVAVFVNEGQIADVFTPGSYTLETQNLPILTTLKGWKYGSPCRTLAVASIARPLLFGRVFSVIRLDSVPFVWESVIRGVLQEIQWNLKKS